MSKLQYPPGYLEEYMGQPLLSLSITFIVLETVCVALRFYARRIGKVSWGADDTLIIPGFVFCIAVCASIIADIKYGGIGYHEAALSLTTPEKLEIRLQFTVAISLLYLAAVVFPKLAILALYLRVFTRPRFRIACCVLATCILANWIGSTVAGLLLCRPLAYLWDRTILGGHCLDTNPWLRWASLVNIVTDVAMLILPLPEVWQLHTSRNVKIGLTITFATGSIGLITSIIRFVSFFKRNAEEDGTYSAVDLFVWTLCEPGMYLIAACLPTYKPLARSLWESGSLAFRLVSAFKHFRVPKTTRVSEGSKSSRWRPEDGSINIPLQSRQIMGFKRLQNEADSAFSFPKAETTISTTERGQMWAEDPRGNIGEV